MTLTLRHTTGPLAGQEQTFGNDRERIVIGREPLLCDIVYPPECTIVGRTHATLVRKLSGDYALDLLGDHYVAINGEPAEPGTAVPAGATLTLGNDTGPSFTAKIDRTVVSPNLAATQRQAHPTSARQLSRRARTVALAALVLAVLGLGGGYAYTRATANAERAERVAIVEQLAALQTEQKAAAAERIPEATRARLAESVFAVVKRDGNGNESLVGTAWAVRPDLLATNAHVAAEQADLKRGESLYARLPGDGRQAYRIVETRLHPGFMAFRQFLDDDPFYVRAYGGVKPYENGVGGYDVAVMRVEPPVQPDRVLTVADGDRLVSLSPGEPVAYAGYPYEGIVGREVQPLGRTPQVQVGNVTALTDYFLLPGEPEQRGLIQHNLPLTGGASGSPLIDAEGHVVGLVSAINIVTIGENRAPSAALINYAQRADTLVALIEGRADAELKADQAYWTRQTAAFQRGSDSVIERALSAVRPVAAAQPNLGTSYEQTLDASFRVTSKDADGNPTALRVIKAEVPVQAGTRHFAVAYAKGSAQEIRIGRIVKGKLSQDGQVGSSSWAGMSYTAPADGTQTFVVITQDADVTVIFRDYTWQLPKPKT